MRNLPSSHATITWPVFGSTAAAGSVPARCSGTALLSLPAIPGATIVNVSGEGNGTLPAPLATAYCSCELPAVAMSGWSVGGFFRPGIPPKSPWNTTPRSPLGSTSGIEPMPGSGS